MVAATLILLCTRPLAASVFGQLPWLLTVPSIAIIGREVSDYLCFRSLLHFLSPGIFFLQEKNIFDINSQEILNLHDYISVILSCRSVNTIMDLPFSFSTWFLLLQYTRETFLDNEFMKEFLNPPEGLTMLIFKVHWPLGK